MTTEKLFDTLKPEQQAFIYSMSLLFMQLINTTAYLNGTQIANERKKPPEDAKEMKKS